MKNKNLWYVFMSVLSFVACSIAIVSNVSIGKSQEIRTITYNKVSFDDSVFSEFDNYNIVEDEFKIEINAEKTFSADIFDGLDLVGFDNYKEDTFVVEYDVCYIEGEDTVFLATKMIGAEEVSIIDTVPGLISINASGESDILFSVDDELIWLSDLDDSSAIDNTGWFKSIVKKITNAAVEVSSAVVSALEAIIKPAVKISTYFAIKLIGADKAAQYGATMLNMSADTEGIYHADFDCWQQYFGYTDLYDVVFDCSTSMRSAQFSFDVNNDRYDDYVLWVWKGDYLNLGAGAELGIYKRWEYSDKIWKVDKSNAMNMTLKLEHNKKGVLFDWQPTAKQWWITGFDYKTQNVARDDLTATFTVSFSNPDWYECFSKKWYADKRININYNYIRIVF